MSTALLELFAAWPAVAVEEAILPAQPPPCPAEEFAQIVHATLRRQTEFATVRLCARRAAARLGVPPFALPNDENRAPNWPASLVGSLTHTGDAPGGYCAAAVARADDVRTIGLDAEQAQPLPLRLWRFVLTPREHNRLSSTDPDAQGMGAKIMFSAKECFYKAQFPLTRRRLGFQEVEIALDFAAEVFQVEWSASLVPDVPAAAWTGRFSVDGALVRTGMAVPR